MSEQRMNVFYHGDCLLVMKHDIPTESIDLIYLDPPFYTGVVQKGLQRNNKKVLYKDRWKPGAMEVSYEDSKNFWKEKGIYEKAPEWMKHIAMEQPAFASYLFYMMERLQQCFRVLKPTGSIYLHCDYRASHYLKMIMDEVFGYKNFKNEIVWGYSGGAVAKKYFSRKHDTIFFYTKTNEYAYNIEYKHYAPTTTMHTGGSPLRKEGTPVTDFWDDLKGMSLSSKERTGYPTQKPKKLLNRIINISSNKGDIILDPFCGCGTTVISAHELNRRWIGIDINEVAFDTISKRCNQTNLDNLDKPLNPTIVERTLESIIDMIDNDTNTKGQKFERWVNEFYGATKPYPDDGIDGITEDGIPIQVKSYVVGDSEIRRFAGDVRDHPKVPQPCFRGLFVAKGFNDNARQQVYKTKENRGFMVEMIEPKDMLRTEEE